MQEIKRYESIRQIYLDNGMDADWVNNRMDILIDKENEHWARFTRLMLYQQRRDKRGSACSKVTPHRLHTTKDYCDTSRTGPKINYPISISFPAPDLLKDLYIQISKSGALVYRNSSAPKNNHKVLHVNQQIFQASYFPVHFQQNHSSEKHYP